MPPRRLSSDDDGDFDDSYLRGYLEDVLDQIIEDLKDNALHPIAIKIQSQSTGRWKLGDRDLSVGFGRASARCGLIFKTLSSNYLGQQKLVFWIDSGAMDEVDLDELWLFGLEVRVPAAFVRP